MKELIGIHHVTAITSDAKKIYEFYTYILGMRLVKKNVNQDDLNTYHLFFADDRGNPGTDMTFFDFKGIPPHQKGTNDISRTTFRVKDDSALEYWVKRFDHFGVKHQGIRTLLGRKFIYFKDFDDQAYALVSDENIPGVLAGEPWSKGPVPDDYAIVGLGPIMLSINDKEAMHRVLTNILQMRLVKQEGSDTLYEMGEGGNGASVIVTINHLLPPARQGFGGVHHVAFRVENQEHLNEWIQYFNELGYQNSGFVDRFYFASNYIRLYPNILFELATDGPGFIDDQESYEILGETLTLPPHLREHRAYVEKQVTHFDTVRSTQVFEKEYFD